MAPSNAREGMSWDCLLDEDDIKRLDEEFGANIVSPGFTGEYGRDSDDWGRLYIPAAAIGYAATRKRLMIWQSKILDDKRYNWWPNAAKDANIAVIVVSDVLAGIKKTDWDCYRDQYRIVREKRYRHRFTSRAREAAVQKNESRRSQDAARVLDNLQVRQNVSRLEQAN